MKTYYRIRKICDGWYVVRYSKSGGAPIIPHPNGNFGPFNYEGTKQCVDHPKHKSWINLDQAEIKEKVPYAT